MVRVNVISGRELDQDLIDIWTGFQQQAGLLSPHFSPYLVLAASASRPGVEVAVMEDAGEVVGFLPYHRERNIAGPFAGEFSDLQGVVAKPEVRWSMEEILRSCRLSAWRFKGLVSGQKGLES